MAGLRASVTSLFHSAGSSKRNYLSQTRRLLQVYSHRTIKADREIRVLALQPSSNLDDPVVCRICPLRTDQPEAVFEYEALSYCWGSASKALSIQVYDNPHQKDIFHVPVTQNLYTALQRLRLPNKERLVWADAVCINQNDGDEKVSQIAMMGQIYSNATGVVVFLGDTHETKQIDIDESIDTVMKLNELVHERWHEAHTVDENFDPYPLNLGTVEIFFWMASPEESARRWWAVLRLFQRPWFFRIWILQELILAKQATVIWGTREISWGKILATAKLISMASNRLLLPFEPKYTGVDTALVMGSRQEQDKFALERDREDISDWVPFNTMMIFRNFQATVSNDKYNAILGLLKTSSIHGVSDTTKETPAKLFHALATAYIAAFGKVFTVLSLVDGVPQSSRAAVPSWVPDWSQTGIPQPWSTFAFEGKCIFNACGASKPILRFDDTLKILHAGGKPFGSIAEVSSVYDPPVRNFDSLTDGAHLARETRTRTKACFAEYLDIWTRHSSDEFFADMKSAMDFFWRLLICNLGAGAEPAREEEAEYFHHFYNFYSDPEIYLNADNSTKMLHRWEDAGRFEALMKFWSMTNRVFFATHNGLFGWAPRHAREGDIVTILAGAPVPFLLRPASKAGEFLLLGECYVHGLMDGTEFERDTRELYDIVIV